VTAPSEREQEFDVFESVWRYCESRLAGIVRGTVVPNPFWQDVLDLLTRLQHAESALEAQHTRDEEARAIVRDLANVTHCWIENESGIWCPLCLADLSRRSGASHSAKCPNRRARAYVEQSDQGEGETEA
jgi:hypothetical protein